jgi:predicted RNA methylase
VVGFDFSPELVAAAQANVERNRRRMKVSDVELVVADAQEWEIPDDVTIVFMYNPFGGEILDAFLDNVLASLERRPRQLRLLYVNPEAAERIERRSELRLLRTAGESKHGPATRLYEAR